MSKKLLLPILAFLVTAVSFSGCKKEQISPTPAEVTSNEIRTVMKRVGSGRAFASVLNQFPNTFRMTDGLNWTISNGFFITESPNGKAYNLAYLKSYNITYIRMEDGSRSDALFLYFE